jgi:hypothetical protein
VPTAPYPGYPPYAPQPGYPAPAAPGYAYPGYPPPGYPYPGYGYPAWPPVPPQPKRDTYLLAVAIAAFACSCLAILGGLGSLALVGLLSIVPTVSTAAMPSGTFFAGVMLFVTFAIAGIVGGGFCAYHSIRSLFFRKGSKAIWLPRFWIFLLCYLATLGLGFWLHSQGLDTSSPWLLGLLVYLGGIFPAMTIMALGLRRLRFPKIGAWPTSWRRFTLALVSGATLGIGLASILELVFELILMGGQANNIMRYISDPNSGNPPPSLYGILLVMLAVVAPLVEELIKPLAVVILIGRVRSKAEAFALGLACGIGFNLVETTGYISSGYHDWLNVALIRSGAGLLHGFGAAMMALGWYCLTHQEEGTWKRRIWLALGCAGYAFFQHALWNGSIGLAFLPDPIGTFFSTWNWTLGPLTIDGSELVNIVEMIGILIFFLYMAGRLRTRPAAPEKKVQPAEGASIAPA